MATNQNQTPSATTPLLQGDSVTQISPTWYKYLNNLATNLNNMLSSLYALLSGAIFTGPVDTTQTTLTIAPATAAGHAVNKGQLAVPQITVLTSGSGTYTTPANAKYLTVKMVGGGGGGMGGGTGGTAGAGGNGTGSLFGTSLLTCTAGVGGVFNSAGQPGSGTVNAPAVGVGLLGGYGAPNVVQSTAAYVSGGNGGNSAFGAGGGGAAAGISNPYAGGTNTGAGGGGGSLNNTVAGAYSGSGGGAGGYVEAMIPAPLNSTYAYTVGTGGTAGAVGTGGASGGAVGGSGVIIVTAYFLP